MFDARDLKFEARATEKYEIARAEAEVKAIRKTLGPKVFYSIVEYEDAPGDYQAYYNAGGQPYLIGMFDSYIRAQRRCTRHYNSMLRTNILHSGRTIVWHPKKVKPADNLNDHPLLLLVESCANSELFSIVVGYYIDGEFVAPTPSRNYPVRVKFWAHCLPKALRLPKKVRAFYTRRNKCQTQ